MQTYTSNGAGYVRNVYSYLSDQRSVLCLVFNLHSAQLYIYLYNNVTTLCSASNNDPFLWGFFWPDFFHNAHSNT
jgi:hypothetical protein